MCYWKPKFYSLQFFHEKQHFSFVFLNVRLWWLKTQRREYPYSRITDLSLFRVYFSTYVFPRTQLGFISPMVILKQSTLSNLQPPTSSHVLCHKHGLEYIWFFPHWKTASPLIPLSLMLFSCHSRPETGIMPVPIMAQWRNKWVNIERSSNSIITLKSTKHLFLSSNQHFAGK